MFIRRELRTRHKRSRERCDIYIYILSLLVILLKKKIITRAVRYIIMFIQKPSAPSFCCLHYAVNYIAVCTRTMLSSSVNGKKKIKIKITIRISYGFLFFFFLFVFVYSVAASVNTSDCTMNILRSVVRVEVSFEKNKKR